MGLRWYQEQAVAAVFDYLRENDGAPCVVLPTGSGKTHVIAELCKQTVVAYGGRALVLAHVKELLEQSRDKLSLYLSPEMVGVYSAGLNERTTDTPVVVAGIQSVYKRATELGSFHLIVVDEAHLIPPEGYGRYRKFFDEEKKISPRARLVGLTATPYRLGSGWIVADRAKEERLLDSICYEVPIVELIKANVLSNVVSKDARSAPNFEHVKTTRGDFDEGEVEKILDGKNVLWSICKEIVEQTKDRRKVVVFCNRRESAKKCAAFIASQDPDHETAVVDGETGAGERAEIVRRFKNETGDSDLFGNVGKPLKYVCNVGVFTTGFDAPNVDCVALVRPTQSLTLYQQMVGRGLRVAEDKRDCLVLDFGGNIERHGPIDVAIPASAVGREARKKYFRKCGNCGAYSKPWKDFCENCGEPFPKNQNDPNANLSERSSGSPILSNEDEPPKVEEFSVDCVSYSAHYKKDSDKPPTFQVEYKRGEFRRPLFEWLCVEHESRWARRRFENWWKSKSKVEPPTTVDDAVSWANAGALATPKVVRTVLRSGSRFPEIEWLEASEIPDFDPTQIKSDFDEFVGFDEFASFDGTQNERFEESADADPRQETARRCQNCGEWNDYGLDDFSGFCWAYNCEQNGTSPACSEHFKERFIDAELPF